VVAPSGCSKAYVVAPAGVRTSRLLRSLTCEREIGRFLFSKRSDDEFEVERESFFVWLFLGELLLLRVLAFIKFETLQ